MIALCKFIFTSLSFELARAHFLMVLFFDACGISCFTSGSISIYFSVPIGEWLSYSKQNEAAPIRGGTKVLMMMKIVDSIVAKSHMLSLFAESHRPEIVAGRPFILQNLQQSLDT